MQTAPIALFCYNRPNHLTRCLEALKHNKPAPQSELFIFCDGAKSETDADSVEQTRAVARSAGGFSQIHIRESNVNRGLASSLSSGISEVCGRYGSVIVVEDDTVVSSSFLEYMNEALRRYEREEKVMQISGYMFPIDFGEPPRGFFLPLTTSWGWATWQRAWRHFSNDPKHVDLTMLDKETEHRFDLDGSYPYSRMLRERIDGKNESWDIIWWWIVFLAEGLVLHPSRSLVTNIGFDGSGTHYNKGAQVGLSKELNLYCGQLRMPDEVLADMGAFQLVKQYWANRRSKKKKARPAVASNVHSDQRGARLPDGTCEIPTPSARSDLSMGVLKKIKFLFKKGEPDVVRKKVNKQKQKKDKVVTAPGTTGDNQDLNVYWDPKMADLLETWGEGNAWHEIDFLMANCHGKVLDIACGTGKNMMQLAKFPQLEVHGCDISDFLIRKAIDRGLHPDKLKVADATKTPYADNEFNYSYSIGSIEHFTEEGISAFIAEAHRITLKASFHMLPSSRSGKDEGWLKPYQSAFYNSVDWWLAKFHQSYQTVHVLDSLWKDPISVGKWFICVKDI